MKQFSRFFFALLFLCACKARRHEAFQYSPNGCMQYDQGSKIKLHYKSVIPFSFKMQSDDGIFAEHFFCNANDDSVVIYQNGFLLSQFRSKSYAIASETLIQLDTSGNIKALDSFYVSSKGATVGFFNAYYSRRVKLSKTFFTNGKTKSGLYYAINGSDSVYKEWYETGRLKTLKQFKNDNNPHTHYPGSSKKPSENSEYYPSGVLSKKEKAARHYKAVYQPSGTPKTVSYDSLFGKARIRCEKKYYPNKKIQSFHFFQDGEPCHTWLEYPENGTLVKRLPKAAVVQRYSVYGEPPAPEIFTVVEEHAEFPGGFNALQNYVEKELEYTQYSRPDLLSGNYEVAFEVSLEGKPIFIRAKGFAVEAVEARLKTLIASMPKWKPRRFNGHAISSTFVINLVAY